METQGKGEVPAVKAVEARGKGGVSAAKTVEHQGKCDISAAKAVEPTRHRRCLTGSVLPAAAAAAAAAERSKQGLQTSQSQRPHLPTIAASKR